MRGLVLSLVLYAVGAFFTFGWTYNRPRDCPFWTSGACEFDRTIMAVANGMLWPVYWAAKGAIEATKP